MTGAEAVKLHLTLVVVVSLCLAAFWFEVRRALGGNELSWAYVFEWPLFAAYAIYMWWRFVHEPAPEGSPGDSAAADPGGPEAVTLAAAPVPETPEELEEDAEMAAYNDYLAQLAERDKATDR